MSQSPVNPIGCVIPRGAPAGSKVNLPLATLIRPMIDGRSRGIILLTAPAGGGKTTAIRHLRSVLPNDGSIACFDVGEAATARATAARAVAVLAAVDPEPRFTYLQVFAISPWSIDDCLEYLLANHRQQCGPVLSRLTANEVESTLGGSPEILATVLQAMATDGSITSGRDALRRLVRRAMPAGKLMQDLLEGLPFQQLLDHDQHRWWRHEPVRRMCEVDWIVGQLCNGILPDRMFHIKAAGDWIDDIATDARDRPEAVAFLDQFFQANRGSSAASVVASLLLAIDFRWRPEAGSAINLAGARLAGARWTGVDLTGADLRGADLSGADLANAILLDVNADGVDLSGALLWAARMHRAQLAGANLLAADLTDAVAPNSDFSNADLRSAILRGAKFQGAKFVETDLSGADCAEVDFSGAKFSAANFDQGDFGKATFFGASFRGSDLSNAGWTDADFRRARLLNCNLEGLELPGADFAEADLSGSLLTGSRMHGANFRGANLTATGLADIDWEGADLRDADLTRASFHLGSTRSGLVGSVIAGEGSRTGFYTDDFNDQTYRPAEEIRKANLCGANLMEAQVHGTDFYLVDLRRAVYSKGQAIHFARTGAILRGE
jgi:uncharacterized protein YjbI with pentapeptide repeats